MTEEEEALAASTPGYRFDARAGPAAPAPGREPTARGAAFVEAALADPERPVVMFALEWCEFCWAMRRFFDKAGIAFRSIDLDSVAYQEGDIGGEIRAALGRRIGTPTIPQVFVGGRACRRLHRDPRCLAGRQAAAADGGAEHPVPPRRAVDPYALLPKWVHPR